MRTIIRDSIWGDIALGEQELALIDTEDFQRLRRVRQLGFADLVFPGATHTRFEHSLGVLHLARLAIEGLRSDKQWPDIAKRSTDAVVAAALLHDVGHYPFSHTLEELQDSGFHSHTSNATTRINEGAIHDVLTNVWDVDPQEVVACISGERRDTDASRILGPLIDSGLDADKLDYLVRDARGANVPYGVVDVQRLIHNLTIGASDQPQTKFLAVKRKGVPALQSLVFAKHLMYSVVYWHHACRSAAVMLLRAVASATDSGALNVATVANSDDAQLLAVLESIDGLPAKLTNRLRQRDLYKRGIEFLPNTDEFAALEKICSDPVVRANTEALWASELKVSDGDILADVQASVSITVDVPIAGDNTTGDFDESSLLLRSDIDRLQEGARRARIFTTNSEVAERVRRNVAALMALI